MHKASQHLLHNLHPAPVLHRRMDLVAGPPHYFLLLQLHLLSRCPRTAILLLALAHNQLEGTRQDLHH